MAQPPPINQIEDHEDVTRVGAIEAGPDASRPGNPSDLILYLSDDLGRADLWNGSQYIPIGLSESEISLGNLGSRQHSSLNGIGEDDHHAKDHDHSEADISQVPNSGLVNTSISIGNTSITLGGSGNPSIDDLSDAALPNATSPGQIPIWNGTSSQFENAEISGGNAIGISTGDASTTIAVNSNSIGSSELVKDSVSVAGNTVSLGGATGVDLADLGTAPHSALDDAPTDAHHNRDHDHTEAGISSIPNTGLVNNSVTIASTTIALGGSATFGLSELTDLDAGSSRITSVTDPTNAQDVATKSYADSVASGLEVKDSARVATDGSDIDLTGGTFGGSIDGVSLNDGDRALIKDQATASENGIYDYDSGTNTFSRSSDFDSDSDVTAGAFTFVEEGTANQDNGFVVTSDDPISVGTDAINFGQFSGAGQITAGTGLNKSGDTLSVDEPNVDHDNLNGFVSNEHIDHSGVTITGGVGLSGGGDLTASRTIDMDIPGMTSLGVSPAADDQFAVYDASAGSHKEVAYTEIESGLNHDNLSGFVSNEHIDHSAVSISAGTGLSGGGDLTTSRTINMDISGMTSLNAAPATGDQIPLYDTSAGSHVEVELNELVQGLDGDILDIDWTPSTYAPDSGAAEASDADDLAAHLKGIDDELGSLASSGGGITWQTVSTNTTASVDNGYVVDTSLVTITLPSSPSGGDVVAVAFHSNRDGEVDPNGNDIRNSPSNLELGENYRRQAVYLVFDANDNNWVIALSASQVSLDIGNDDVTEDRIYEIQTANEPSTPIVTNPNPGRMTFDWSNLPVDGFIETGGLTISNNGTDSDHDIDTVGGKIGVHDFAGNWVTVELPDETPAFQIDTTGDDGLINGSSLTANTWYELAVIADSSGSNSPSVVGYTDANRPTASSDLPTGFDLFRAMGTPGNTWWVHTDGSSNIHQFKHGKNNRIYWKDASLSDFSVIFNSTSPSNNNTATASSQIPPTMVDVWVNSVQLDTNKSGPGFVGIHGEQMSGWFLGQTSFQCVTDSIERIGAKTYVPSDQTIHIRIANTSNLDRIKLERIASFRCI